MSVSSSFSLHPGFVSAFPRFSDTLDRHNSAVSAVQVAEDEEKAHAGPGEGHGAAEDDARPQLPKAALQKSLGCGRGVKERGRLERVGG